MPTFLEMLRNPGFQQAGFAALGDASYNPYANPILEFALAGRQGFERYQAEEAERQRRAEELERRRRAERRQEQALELKLFELAKDPANRLAIAEAYGEDMLAPYAEQLGELDRALGEQEVEAAARERAAAEAAAQQLEALGAQIENLPPAARPGAAALLEAGQGDRVAQIIKELSRPRPPAKASEPVLRSGSSPLIRVDPRTGAVETLYTPPDRSAGEERERLVRSFEDGIRRQVEAKIRGMQYVGENEPPTLLDIRRQAEGLADEVMGAASPQVRFNIPSAVAEQVRRDIDAGKPFRQIQAELAEAFPNVDVEAYLRSLGGLPGG